MRFSRLLPSVCFYLVGFGSVRRRVVIPSFWTWSRLFLSLSPSSFLVSFSLCTSLMLDSVFALSLFYSISAVSFLAFRFRWLVRSRLLSLFCLSFSALFDDISGQNEASDHSSQRKRSVSYCKADSLTSLLYLPKV